MGETAGPENPDDHAPGVPGVFGIDTDPFTEEDGIGDDVDQPLPDVEPPE